jgi:cellobiose dehydrogenase (acceptor)
VKTTDTFSGGIGPTDQLQVVQTSTDGPTMINSSYWINTPVGYNLDDHLNVCTNTSSYCPLLF